MGCAGCKKNNARREAGKTIYLKCPICDTLLHGKTKDMKSIDGNRVCGECYAKYKKILELKKATKNVIRNKASKKKRSDANDNSRVDE